MEQQSFVIRTKLQLPRLAADLIPRPHLIEKLDRGRAHVLTLVCAPAGYGKSTLLASWVAETKRDTVWFSVDEHDSDLRVFFAHVIAGLHAIPPEPTVIAGNRDRRIARRSALQ